MGCMLRSDPMTYCEIYIQPEAAFGILAKLGEESCVQFEDMTPSLVPSQRHYFTDLCRCVEMERVLTFIEGEIKKDQLTITSAPNEPPPMGPDEMNEFESLLEKWEENLKDMASYQTKLLENQMELQEMYYVLKNIDPIIGNAEIRRDSLFKAAGGGEPALGGKLHVFTGVVRRSKAYAFETMLWRISRGNIFFRPSNQDELFEDPLSGLMIRKVAFLAVCQGDLLSGIMEKVCSGFHAHMYNCPRTYAERQETVLKLDERIMDLTQVIQKTKYHRCKQLRQIGRNFDSWLMRIKKTKSIYYYLNLLNMDITTKCLIGQCWIPTANLNKVQSILDAAGTKSGSKVQSFVSKINIPIKPPTYHRTNKFTFGFQALISAYGDAVYGELNPGLYTIITFPFLFAIMFGDFGHGLVMFSFAIWMVANEKKFLAERSTNEIWNIFFGGRYVILLMSMFTMYTGALYNDFFSKPIRLMPNFWLNTYTSEILEKEAALELDPAAKTGQLYLIGIDPAWGSAKNKIRSENSIKMKLSIIIGITHMMFGLWLSLFNHIYFKKYYAIILEFIPQLLILTCLFVWLVIMVFMKWVMYGAKKSNIKLQPTCAPSILILFIDMCLFRSTVVEEGSPCDPYLFPHQGLLQKVLVLVALVNIPILLFGSPIYLVSTNRKKKILAEEELYNYLDNKKNSNIDLGERDQTEMHLLEEIEAYSESFGDLMIHQGVHTIEYVLSTISHTASYLRLWALSLAHSQLAEMLWVMVLSKLALTDHSYIGIIKLFIIFAIWAMFSLSILVVMEGLSAFLHTLRLHWVEFMSKFFLGGGTIFHPFSFKESIYGENKDEKAMEAGCKKKK